MPLIQPKVLRKMESPRMKLCMKLVSFFLWSNLFFSPAWAEKYPFSIIKECVDDSMTAGLFIEMLHDFSDY